EHAIELLDERARRLVLALLAHRPRRLEEGAGQALRILGHAEIEVVGVVVLALLVRDAPEREVGEVLDGVVAAVDEEREAVLIRLLDDLAQRLPRRRVVAAARVREASEVQRGREEARLAVDVREARLGA